MKNYMLILFLLIIILWFGLNTIIDFFDKIKPIVNQELLVDKFNNNGYIIIPNVLSNSECNVIINTIKNELNNSKVEFGNINSQHKRIDLKLPLENGKINKISL